MFGGNKKLPGGKKISSPWMPKGQFGYHSGIAYVRQIGLLSLRISTLSHFSDGKP